MIKRLILLISLMAVPAVAQDEGGLPNNFPIISNSIPFSSKVNRAAPFTVLEPGSVSEAQNMCRISPGVPSGWTTRRGMTEHNSTAIGTSTIDSIHQYINKDIGTRCFLAQYGNTAIYSATNDPPAVGATFGTNIYTATGATGIAVSDHINDDWVCAVEGARPFAWSGGTAYPDGFVLTIGEASPTSPTVVNGTFETGDPPDNWTEVDVGGIITVSRSNTQAHGATYSLKIEKTANGTAAYVESDFITVIPLTTYSVDGFYYDNEAEIKVEIEVYEYTSSDVLIGRLGAIVYSPSDTAAWREFTTGLDITSENAAKIKIRCAAEPIGGSVPYTGINYFDDITVTAYSMGQSNWRDGYYDVRNTDTAKYIGFINDSSTVAYVGYRRPLKGVNLYFNGTQQDTVATLTVQALRDGTWTTVSNMSDGTSVSSKTFNQNGAITWDADSTDDPFLMSATGDHLFWYKLTVSADITDGVQVYKATVTEDCQAITNLSNGIWQDPDSVFEYDPTTYANELTDVTDGDSGTYVSTMNADDEYLYIGSSSRIFAMYIDVYTDGNTTQSAGTTVIEYWKGSNESWTALSTVLDGTHNGTYAFAHSGIIQWDPGEVNEDQRLWTAPGIANEYIDLPLYWYRMSVTDTSYLHCYEMAVMYKPESIPKFKGVIQYHGRALWWPGELVKSGIGYSQDGAPNIYNGDDSGETGNIFGDGVVNKVVLLSAGAIVSTENPYKLYALTGTTPATYQASLISDRVGVIAPNTMVFVGGGIRLFSRDTLSNAVVFMASDGIYMTNGNTVINISDPVWDYFNASATPYIEPSYMHMAFAWVNYEGNTVHFAVPVNTGTTQTTLNRELVYNYVTDEWYDYYSRQYPAACGVSAFGSDNTQNNYIGDYNGKVFKTNTGTIDVSTIITSYVKTSAISPFTGAFKDYLNYKADVIGIKLKAGADTTTGSECKITAYADGNTTGVAVGDISLVRAGYSYINDYLPVGSGTAGTPLTGEEFLFKFQNEAVANSVMTLYGFTFDYLARRPTY